MKRENLRARIETYDGQDGPKSKYMDIGVRITKDDGRTFILLEPTVNLAGVLSKQNELAARKGEPPRTSVMVSAFDNSDSP